jgi:16S rRNA G527 N7-methylase RsmG
LALVLPGLTATLLESTGKKAAFLRRVTHALGLRCEISDMRLELYLRKPFAAYDYAISRATFTPRDWLEVAPSLVRPGGAIIVMTGREAPPSPSPSFTLEKAIVHELPDGEQRHLGLYRST